MFKRKFPSSGRGRGRGGSSGGGGTRFQAVSLGKKEKGNFAPNEEDDENNNGAEGRMMDDLSEESSTTRKFAEVEQLDQLDAQMGFARFQVGPPRQGWLTNFQTTLVKDADWNGGRSAIDCYFMQEDGDCFKATVSYSPYFFIKVREGKENEVEDFLRRKFENTIEHISRDEKEDLDMVHLIYNLCFR